MLKLLSDENFSGPITRGILLVNPVIDIVRVQDVGLRGHTDPEILNWAAEHDRILITHDRDTIPDFAYERVRLGHAMPGVFLVNDDMPIGKAVDEIVLAVECLTEEECQNMIRYFPLT